MGGIAAAPGVSDAVAMFACGEPVPTSNGISDSGRYLPAPSLRCLTEVFSGSSPWAIHCCIAVAVKGPCSACATSR